MLEPDGRVAVAREKSFTGDWRGVEFANASMEGALFLRAQLRDVTMRAVDVAGVEIDSPWGAEDDVRLVVNGVNVVPLVEAELNRRFPGREARRAMDPDGLRGAWAKLEKAWDAALARAAAMPEGSIDTSVDGEWSFSQTLRHLVLVTDIWLRGTIQEIRDPYHPIGQPSTEYVTDGHDISAFSPDVPAYAEVLAVRAGRIAMVREFMAELTGDLLDETRPNLWAPEYEEAVRSCLHMILEEEWEHLRFALRDLDHLALTAGVDQNGGGSSRLGGD